MVSPGLELISPAKDVFPWFHLIQWSAEDAKNNRIFRYDLAGAQQKALALSKDVDAFLRLCPTTLPKARSGRLAASAWLVLIKDGQWWVSW